MTYIVTGVMFVGIFMWGTNPIMRRFYKEGLLMRTEKRCHKCKIVKPASEFYLRSSKKWLRGSCKECDKLDRKI